jgi:hypothetical protein
MKGPRECIKAGLIQCKDLSYREQSTILVAEGNYISEFSSSMPVP